MGILLTDGAPLHVRQAVPQHNPRQREEHGRPVREVGEHERVRDSAVLVQDDKVRDAVGAAGGSELGHYVVSSVDARRVGEAQSHFLQQ